VHIRIDERKILLLLLGMLCGIFVTSVMVKDQSNGIKVLTYSQYQSMSRQRNRLEETNRNLREQLAELSSKYYSYTSSGNDIEKVKETIEKELHDTELFYGITKVTGTGLKVTINDRSFYEEWDTNDATVHNTDIYYLVYELINAGAEAVSVNGNRIVSTTSITCEGPVIKVNDKYIVPPVVIMAIGDGQAMQSYLMKTDEYANIIGRMLPFSMNIEDELTIPAYTAYTYGIDADIDENEK
jgi:uncharacterized protein YlxW (UPF0749 family)